MVDSLAKQMADSLMPMVSVLNSEVAPAIAEDIRNLALSNSNNGKAFGNDPYKKTYEPATIADRKRGNYQTSHVDLRRSKKRIERMKVTAINADTGATISWSDSQDASLFWKHHSGDGKLPIRRIFPDTVESVPPQVHQKAYKLAHEVLNG